MTYIKWFIFALLNLLISILSWVLINPILCLFPKGNDLRFGKKLWQTFDNDLYFGQRQRENEILIGIPTNTFGDTWSQFVPFAQTRWDRYKNRLLWLTRNCCYGWSYYAFGIKWIKSDWTITTFINTPEKVLFIARASTGHFNIFYHGKFGMYKLGWKAWNVHTENADGTAGFSDLDGMGGMGYIPHVFSATPFKRR